MSNYQEYIPNFLPRLRDQARRLSESSPSLNPFPLPPLPQVPDFSAWTARFWNSTSPPPSIEEGDESVYQESTVQALARTIQLWTQQLNSDPFSPPLEPDLDLSAAVNPLPDDGVTTAFPPLDPTAQSRPPRLEATRTNSDTSLNPARRLQNRSQIITNQTRGHSLSDPLAAVQAGSIQQAQHVQPAADVYMEDGRARRRDGSDALPEDDGMGPLRQRINAIWTGPGTPLEKSKLIHILMNERYKATQQQVKAASRRGTFSALRNSVPIALTQEPTFDLSERDLKPTYAPADPDDEDHDMNEPQALGCIHYRRNVKMQCVTCEKWYTCRLCHDEVESHILPRRETRYMLCMLCKTPQPVSSTCKVCNEQAAWYYCPICKLWNNDPRKPVYHCDGCGLCRLGEGLGKDFFHCNTCAACMSIEAESTHKCIERSTQSDCPICSEYLFTSNLPVAFMRCGHAIHNDCFKSLCNSTYKCPICSKSIANMESQFRRLDRSIEEQPMPEGYRDKKAFIFCNDCNSRSVAEYHWLGTKCAICESYNTVQLELLGPANDNADDEEQEDTVAEPSPLPANSTLGERSMTVSGTHTPVEDLTVPPLTRPPPNPLPRPRSAHPTIATSPTAHSPWLMPHSPSSRSVRSVSPIVGSYFGTGAAASPVSMPQQRSSTPITASMSAAAGMAVAAGAELARRISTAGRVNVDEDGEEDEDVGFWGRMSPRSLERVVRRPADVRGNGRGGDSSGESSGDDEDEDSDVLMDDDDDDDEEEDGEGEDVMDIFGHR